MDLQISENKCIGLERPVFIIAEIGQNHQGDINIAKKLMETAKNCGADCVKFQKTDINEKFTKAALAKPYNSPNSWGTTYGEHKKHLEFSEEDFIILQKYAEEIGVLFTASAMDCNSLDFLASIQVPFIKIGSGDTNNYILIERAAKTNIPLIISTGMQSFETVKYVYNLVSSFHKNFALLHCISSYPTPDCDINLNVLKLYQSEFPDVNLGYSGHENGIHISVAAVALGAKIIERHITLNKSQKGTDHKCSLDPEEFKQMVQNIRSLEIALGKPMKCVQKSEEDCYKKLGKSVVYAKYLPVGHKLIYEDLKIKVAEPKGIDGSEINKLIGGILIKSVNEDESTSFDDFSN